MTTVYTTQTVNMLANALGVTNTAGSNISASKSVEGDSSSITSSIAAIQADMGNVEFAHRLILKDRLEGGAHIMSMVTITNDTLSQITEYLKQTQDNLGLLSDFVAGSDDYNAVLAAIDDIEMEMSSYLGNLFHKGTLDFELTSGDPNSAPSFLDFINLYEDPDNAATFKGQIAALEVDMVTLSHATHNPTICPHCALAEVQQVDNPDMLSPLEATVSNSSSANSVGYNSNSAAASSVANYEEINTLLLSTNWDVGVGEALSYSYFQLNSDGTNGYPSTAAYNVTGVDIDSLTESNVDDNSTDTDRDTNNSTYLDQAFGLWDDIVDFNFEKIIEASTSGSTDAGEMRVAFTNRSSDAAAFAIQPGTGVPNGDVWFEEEDNSSFDPSFNFSNFGQDSDSDGIADASAVISRAGMGDSGYSFRSAMHEIGHAIGLSHPFDQSSFTGNTLASSKDLMRNTIMSYTNLDRNSYISFSPKNSGVVLGTYDYQDYDSIDMTGANSYAYGEKRIYASTPMLYDIEAAQYMYGEEQTSGQGRDGNNAYAYDDKAMVIQTIIDSGGTDTIDASRVTRDSIINLTPGSFSSIGIYSRADQLADIQAQAGATVKSNVETFMNTLDGNAATGDAIYTGEDNVAISTKTYIENATGGSGDDTITGNHLNNTIIGGAGNDTIDGGDGDGDLVSYDGNRSAYSMSYDSATGVTTVIHTGVDTDSDGVDDTDTITNVEYITFNTASAVSAQILAEDDFDTTFNTDLSGEAGNLQFYIHNAGWDAFSTANAVSVTLNTQNYSDTVSFSTKADVIADLQSQIDAQILAQKGFASDITIQANSPLRFTTNNADSSQSLSIWGLSSALQNFFGFSQANLSTSAGYSYNVSGANAGSNRIYVNPTSPSITYYVPINEVQDAGSIPSGGYTISASSVTGYGSSSGGSGARVAFAAPSARRIKPSATAAGRT